MILQENGYSILPSERDVWRDVWGGIGGIEGGYAILTEGW